MSFAKEHWKADQRWNGRQIKNAFQTAIALAEWDNLKVSGGSTAKLTRPVLEKSHFETVAAASAHFEMYLQQVRTPDQQRAKTRELRQDDVRELVVPDFPLMKMKTPEMTKAAAYHQRIIYPTVTHSDSELSSTSGDSDEDTDGYLKRSEAQLQEKLQRLDGEKERRRQREKATNTDRRDTSKRPKERKGSPRSGKQKTHGTEHLAVESANSGSDI
ncbi:hypothetical protein MMC18_008675 [Xylographa bjoerkii]|nr:hypothetical protein [Xylographa bjoerkii]